MFRHLTLKQLETFYWAARLGSFSGAARRLNTTQPSVTVRIRDMEAALGTPLFERTGRVARLTPKGQELVTYVERMVALGEEFDSAIEGSEAVSGLVRIGAADTVALTWLPQLMAELGHRYPRIGIELFVDLSVNLRSRLLVGDIDIGFIVGEFPRPGFTADGLGRVAQRWMCSPSLGLKTHDVTGGDIVKWPVFTHTRGSDQHQTTRDWLDAEGVRAVRQHGCNSLATMVALTAAGLGASVLPFRMLEAEQANRQLAVLETRRPVPSYEFRVIRLTHPPRRAVELVAELARKAAGRSVVFDAAG